ncbi:hypothetical protein Tco_0292096 [Tanacetum coccineum]
MVIHHVKSIKRLNNAQLLKTASKTQIESSNTSTEFTEIHLMVPPKKSRGKCLQGKKTADVSQESVDVSEESEPKPTKKKTGSRKQEDADTTQALKESKKTSRRQPSTEGSSKGTGRIPGVPDESTVVSTTLSEGTEQESEYLEEDQRDDEEVYWIYSDKDDEKKDDADDDKSINLEMTDGEETDIKFVHGDEQVNDDEDEEMLNAEVEDSGKGDAKISDMVKANAEKNEEIKDDAKKAELPLTASNLSISLSFGDQFLKLSSNTSLVSSVKDTTDAEINSLLDIKIQSEVPYIQSPFVLTVYVLVISEPSVLTPIPETPSTTLLPPLSVSAIPPIPHKTTKPIPTPPISTDAPTITNVVFESDALSAVQLRVAKLEKDVFKLKKINHSAEAFATFNS